MKNKQMVSLFFCNFAVFFTGGALLPLLPLYATELGGTPTLVGLYLAAMYLAIAAGTMLPGWLGGRVPRKGLFVAAGLASLPALMLHTVATRLWQVVPLTTLVWFFCGIGTALVSIFIGLHADTRHRGRSFGLMFLARPLGGVIGSLAGGQLVAGWGYATLFMVLTLVLAAWPVMGLLLIKDEPAANSPAAKSGSGRPTWRLGNTFYLLVLAAFFSTAVVYSGRLGASLSMHLLDFSPQAVAGAVAIGSLVTTPIPLLIGVLSDRLGRRLLLALCYLLAAAGAVVLGAATEFWQFGLALVLLFTVTSANGSVAPAFATDLLSSENLSRGLSWLNAMTWLGGVLGFAGGGWALDTLGPANLFLLAAFVAVAAAATTGGVPHRFRFNGRFARSSALPRKV